MIKINSQELRNAVQAAYEFDKEHGTRVDDGILLFDRLPFEVYKFEDKIRAYYFQEDTLFSYEDVV